VQTLLQPLVVLVVLVLMSAHSSLVRCSRAVAVEVEDQPLAVLAAHQWAVQVAQLQAMQQQPTPHRVVAVATATTLAVLVAVP
jgi:hypothetical protein